MNTPDPTAIARCLYPKYSDEIPTRAFTSVMPMSLTLFTIFLTAVSLSKTAPKGNWALDSMLLLLMVFLAIFIGLDARKHAAKRATALSTANRLIGIVCLDPNFLIRRSPLGLMISGQPSTSTPVLTQGFRELTVELTEDQVIEIAPLLEPLARRFTQLQANETQEVRPVGFIFSPGTPRSECVTSPGSTAASGLRPAVELADRIRKRANQKRSYGFLGIIVAVALYSMVALFCVKILAEFQSDFALLSVYGEPTIPVVFRPDAAWTAEKHALEALRVEHRNLQIENAKHVRELNTRVALINGIAGVSFKFLGAAVAFFAAQVIVGYARYNARLASHLECLADALDFGGNDEALRGKILSLFSPNSISFGKEPKPPTSELIELGAKMGKVRD